MDKFKKTGISCVFKQLFNVKLQLESLEQKEHR